MRGFALIWKVPPGETFTEAYAPIGGTGRRTGDLRARAGSRTRAEGETGELYIGGGLARGYWQRRR